MKKLTGLFFGLCLLTGSLSAQKQIEVSNPFDDNRLELISIPYSKFTKYFGVDSVFTIKDKNSGKILPHQIEKLGTHTPLNVLIQVSVASKAKVNLVVNKEKSPEFTSKTYARYIPERKDDFAWENDVVAFRYYGKALEGTSEDAQGIDFWAKRTTDLIVNKWYKENDYHKDHGQGLDYYSVGQTLGAGDLALYFNDKISFTKHYRTYKILDNGPLRTTFQLTFEPQDIAGNIVSLSKTVTLDAGQSFNKTTVLLENKQSKKTPIVIGLARRNEEKPAIFFDKDDGTLSYWEPQIKDFGQTGTAVVLPTSKIDFLDQDKKQFLIKTVISTNKPFTYYNGATWNKAGKITNAEQWEDHVGDFAEGLRKPLKVKLK